VASTQRFEWDMTGARDFSTNGYTGATAKDALLKRSQHIHKQTLVLDSHVDFEPIDLTGERNYTERVETQFNLPNMVDGGVDALFFVIYVGQTRETRNPDAFKAAGYEHAYNAAIEKFTAVRRLTAEIAPEQIQLATQGAQVRHLRTAGKKAALIGVENGYPLGEELARVEEFYKRGARYISLTHNGHNQLGDSHTGEREGWKWNGVSSLGQEVLAEMNRVGIMVDVSHASKQAMLQTAALSKAPIIASHSSCRALCDVSRNLDDEQLLALKKTGGVVQIVAYGDFLKITQPDSAERKTALSKARAAHGLPDLTSPGQRARAQAALKNLSDEQRTAYTEKITEIDHRWPGEASASVKDLVDHIDYAVKLIGIDHVGIASDFDGGGGIAGWNDASETPNVTVELVRRGYTEEHIAKLWGENILRVMDEVQKIAQLS
jgi:membrane dipeptidase